MRSKYRSLGGLGWAVVLLLVCSAKIEMPAQAQPSSGQGIAVKISCVRPIIYAGDSIDLQAEISNESPTDLFIYRDLHGADNSVARLNLYLRDGSRLDRPVANSAADFIEDHRESFVNQFVKWWIALAPERSYGQKITMSPSDFPQLKVPGRYRIEGEYMSDGFFSPGPNNPLQGYKSELQALLYKAWEGRVDTNSIWIEVKATK